MRPTQLAALIALTTAPCLAAEENPRRDAYIDGKEQLDSLVARAERGALSRERLRSERRRVERRLEQRLAQAPAEAKPGEVREASAARAEMNQSVICSQEFEFFGPEDRPEWGWFPSRRIQSVGSHLTVEKDGRSSYSALK